MTSLNESHKEKYKNDFNQRINSYKESIQEPDYTEMNFIKKLMVQIDRIENRPTYILDLFLNNFFFVSQRYIDLLGYNPGNKVDYNFFFEALHPDDYSINIEAPSKYLEYIKDLSSDEKFDYKLLSDYRLRDCSGEYIRVIENITLLETDSKGNSWLVLAICDLSADQDIMRDSGAILINNKHGDIVFKIGDYNALLPNQLLTRREFEILKLIAKGRLSKQIADMLGLSINTVNNHRRNILSKTGCSNTFEAMKYLGNFM